MFDSLWRTLGKNPIGPSRREKLPKERQPSSRPQLEALEDRVMPALWPGAVPLPSPPPTGSPAPGSFSNLQPLTEPPTASTNQMMVTVMANSPESVINLDLVFAEMGGLQCEDGLQLSLLGNTNTSLVTTDLSESELALQYTPGQCGTATITVGATDADGVSAQESILVMVTPLDKMSMATMIPTPSGTMSSPTPFPSV